jgi:hypothetical protein
MISDIGNNTSYYSSLFATNSTNGSSAGSGSASLAQVEQQLFASIDTNGNGSISQGEFTSFLNKTAASAGNASDQTQAANALFAKMSGGTGAISLQQFQADAGDLLSQLQSEIAAGSASTPTTGSSSATSSLLSQLAQSAQALVSGSAASIASPSNSSATSSSNHSTNTSGHHRHHGGEVGNSLISQFMQQYQAAGGTSAATSTLSASA